MSLPRALAVLVVLLAGGCALDPVPLEGRVCRSYLDCLTGQGYFCQAVDAGDGVDGGVIGICVSISTLDSGIDAAAVRDGGADTGVDAGSDADVDAGSDADVDGGSDADVDAATDADVDGGADAGADGGADAGVDGGADAGVDGGSDAGSDAGDDAGTDAG